MKSTKYILDNNVLSQMTSDQRNGVFVRDHRHIPSDVMYEARGYLEEALQTLEYSTSINVLKHIRDVMAFLPVTDTDLVDLYSNKGMADPAIIACALDAIERESDTLFKSTWVIVSEDTAINRTANLLGVEAISTVEFFERLSSSQ